MKILWQTEHYPDARKGGGSVTNTRYISEELRRLDHDVTILANGRGQAMPGAAGADRDVMRLTPPRLPDRLWPIWPLLEPLALRKPLAAFSEVFDAFVCHDPGHSLALKHLHPARPVVCRVVGAARIHDACVAPRLKTKRTVLGWSRQGTSRLMALLDDQLDLRAWLKADALVVQSEFMKRDVAALYGIPTERIRVIPSGVDHERFARAQPGAAIRALIGDPLLDRTIVTFCGRLVPMKNVSYLLQGLAAMRQRHRCLLLIAGDGGERPRLEGEARQLGVGQDVRFLGHTERVDEILALSDLFVLPSVYEPFANALLEAMAAGLPCLALRPDFRAVRTSGTEIVRDGDTGFLVNPNDPRDLADRLDFFVTHPPERKAMGARAQQWCGQTYSWTTCARRYLLVLEELAEALRWERRG